MKKIINSVFKKLKNFSAEQRKASVNEIAETIIDTLTLTKLNGTELTATELSFVSNKIQSSVLSFLREKKNKTEETLEDITNALKELEK